MEHIAEETEKGFFDLAVPKGSLEFVRRGTSCSSDKVSYEIPFPSLSLSLNESIKIYRRVKDHSN